MKVACFSVAVMDHFPQTGSYCPGGNALNQAIAYCRMGHSTAFVGALGTDPAGDRIEALLKAESVDLTRLHRLPGKTASNQIVNDAKGERFGVEGSWNGGVYGEFQLGNEDWAHISGHDLWATHANCPSFGETLRRKSAGQLLSVDFLHLTDYALLQSSLEMVDIACFGGTPEMVEPLSAIAANSAGLIVLTLGSAGSIAFKGKQKWLQPALPVREVVDTTGCGDAFQAAFTSAYLRSRSVPEALRSGAEAGRAACGHPGGIASA